MSRPAAASRRHPPLAGTNAPPLEVGFLDGEGFESIGAQSIPLDKSMATLLERPTGLEDRGGIEAPAADLKEAKGIEHLAVGLEAKGTSTEAVAAGLEAVHFD